MNCGIASRDWAVRLAATILTRRPQRTAESHGAGTWRFARVRGARSAHKGLSLCISMVLCDLRVKEQKAAAAETMQVMPRLVEAHGADVWSDGRIGLDGIVAVHVFRQVVALAARISQAPVRGRRSPVPRR